MTTDAVLLADQALAPGREDDAGGSRRLAHALSQMLPLASSTGGHVALGLLALLVVAPMTAPPPRAPARALEVTIVEPPQEPAAEEFVAEPGDAPEAVEDDALEESAQPRLEFAPPIEALAAPPPADAIAEPGWSAAVAEVPETVREAIRGYLRCASAAPAGEAEQRGVEPPHGVEFSACAGALQRFADLAGGAEGLDPTAFIDPAAQRDSGPAAMLKMMSDFAAAHAVDETMFEGRAGDGQAPATGWAMYANGNPLTTDERIIEGQGVDVAAPHLGPPS